MFLLKKLCVYASVMVFCATKKENSLYVHCRIWGKFKSAKRRINIPYKPTMVKDIFVAKAVL